MLGEVGDAEAISGRRWGVIGPRSAGAAALRSQDKHINSLAGIIKQAAVQDPTLPTSNRKPLKCPNRVKGGKTPYGNMFSGLPQTADIGVACRKEIPLAAPVEPPSNFRVGASLDPAVRSPGSAAGAGAAPTSRSAALAAATTRHLFRPSACHLPDYARRRFWSSGWLSHVSTADPAR